MAYDNTNRGAIFPNDRKTEEKHPDRTGSINVEGVEYFIDGWLKKTKEGKPFLSLSVKRKNKQGGQQDAQERPAGRPQPPQRQRPTGAPAQRPAARPPRDPDEGIDENSPDLM